MIVIDKWLKSAKKYIKSMRFSSGAMRYILWYAALLVLCCVLYLIAWGVDWWIQGTPDMKQLLAFLHEIASASWVAVVGFICKGLVDKDKDGIPDEFEKKDDYDEREGYRPIGGSGPYRDRG